MADTLLYELGWKASESFTKLLSAGKSAEWLKVPFLSSEAERFQLWAHSLGLYHEGHASLDYRVRDAVIVKERLSELLKQLIHHSENLLSIAVGERKPAEEMEGLLRSDSSSSSSSGDSESHTEVSSDGSSFHEVEFRLQSLKERLDALYNLATRIRNPRNRPSRTIDQLYKHIPATDREAYIHEHEELETNIISYMLRQDIMQNLDSEEFKTLPNSHWEDVLLQYTSPTCWLVRRAGIANARRKQQLLYWKDHSMRLAQHSHPHGLKETSKIVPVSQDIDRNRENAPTATPSEPNPTAPSLATSATELPALKPEDLKSVISTQSRVSTVIDVRHETLNWPPPPKPTDYGEYFECPYCRTICPARYLKKGAWDLTIAPTNSVEILIVCMDLGRNGLTTKASTREYGTVPNMILNHPRIAAEHFSEELLGTAVRPSTNIHRDCPFCPTAFSNTEEMQDHIAFHLERLALVALTSTENISRDNEASARSSDSQQAQIPGRLGSVIGDFGLRSGLQKIPFSELRIDNMIFISQESPGAGRGRPGQKILAFYNHNTEKFTYYFEGLVECVIEYGLTDISQARYSGTSTELKIQLEGPPIFFTRHGSEELRQCIDFTQAQIASKSRVHVLKLPAQVEEERFQQLAALIQKRLNSNYAASQEADQPSWTAKLDRTEEKLNVNEWILSSDISVVEEDPIEDFNENSYDDNTSLGIEGLEWLTGDEYLLAQDIANATRIKSSPLTRMTFVLFPNTVRMDPVCAICHREATAACSCEAEQLQVMMQAAESRVMQGRYSTIRDWVKDHAKNFVARTSSEQVRANPGDEISEATPMQQRLDGVLDYYFSLVELALPTEDDPSIRNPPLPSVPDSTAAASIRPGGSQTIPITQNTWGKKYSTRPVAASSSRRSNRAHNEYYDVDYGADDEKEGADSNDDHDSE
ncbi:hypothetical protein O1611_g746 [Lasiodiplodia mahajangana]|uniref:Uncharacterized protein n=1 Tax=Lasiodiplodia mahajangana TaxID=1108764 RepID=A0ACC2JZZ5_9PEZI|nr:hypothetical protein O1611_g746 [Lasiodiplodia mahajangana]